MALTETLQREIMNFCPDKQKLSVLEAGGGSTSHFALPESSFITTIDISPEQIEHNSYAQEKILGDIEIFDFGKKKFDLIICWDVIEHLKNPQLALDNLLNALNNQGIIVVGAPIVNSTKGLITKFTPHAFHVFAYRFLLHSKMAGRPGYPPFPAYLRFFISPENLKHYVENRGKEVALLRKVQGIHITRLRERSILLWAMYNLLSHGLRLISAGYIHASDTDFMMIIKNRP